MAAGHKRSTVILPVTNHGQDGRATIVGPKTSKSAAEKEAESYTANSMDLRFRRRARPLEKIEVTALVSLRDTFGIQGKIPPIIFMRRLDPL